MTLYSVDHNRIIVDLDTFYEGDLRFEIYIQRYTLNMLNFRLSISLMKISAGLSDVKFSGKVRCVLHLVDVLPLIGSVEVMFLNAPGLDFDLHGAANFLDLPGLHGMIRSVVTEAIKTQLVYPNKIAILTREDVLAGQMLLPKPVGVLRLTIIEAANLPETDFGGLFRIDPYCHVQVSMFSITYYSITVCKNMNFLCRSGQS